MATQTTHPVSFPDVPEFEKPMHEQVDEILEDVRLTHTSSVGRLFDWVTKHPGPKPAATAAMAVLLRTKKQYTPAEKRLSLLYAVHEVFKGAAKDPDMNLDYEAWKDALRALVPWAWRKQKEEDQAKIKKAVLNTWVSSRWLDREFVESLVHFAGGTPKKPGPSTPGSSASHGGSSIETSSKDTRRRPRGSYGGSSGVEGGAMTASDQGVEDLTKRSGSTAPASGSSSRPTKRPRVNARPNRRPSESGNLAAGNEVEAKASTGKAHDDIVDLAFRDIDEEGYSPPEPDTAYGDAQLPTPPAGAAAAAEAAVTAAGLGTASADSSNGGGNGTGGVNTVTPSPEGNRPDVASPDGAEKEGTQDAQERALSLKLDGCGLIRRIGRSLKFPVRVMLTAFHLFHHYQWCGSVDAFRFPPSSLPAVCLACLLAATKAEDCNAKLDQLLREMKQLEPMLPPLEGLYPLGKRPEAKEVINVEYKILLSRGFDLEVMHPTDHVAELLTLTNAPMEVGALAYELLCSRIYTDSTLCLEEDPMTCLCAAVQLALLSPMPGGEPLEKFCKGMVADWPMLCGATKAVLLSFTERLMQCARDLGKYAPGQTFMIPRNPAETVYHHPASLPQIPPRRDVCLSTNPGGPVAPSAGRSPHSTKTPDRPRGPNPIVGSNSNRKRSLHSRSTPGQPSRISTGSRLKVSPGAPSSVASGTNVPGPTYGHTDPSLPPPSTSLPSAVAGQAAAPVSTPTPQLLGSAPPSGLVPPRAESMVTSAVPEDQHAPPALSLVLETTGRVVMPQVQQTHPHPHVQPTSAGTTRATTAADAASGGAAAVAGLTAPAAPAAPAPSVAPSTAVAAAAPAAAAAALVATATASSAVRAGTNVTATMNMAARDHHGVVQQLQQQLQHELLRQRQASQALHLEQTGIHAVDSSAGVGRSSGGAGASAKSTDVSASRENEKKAVPAQSLKSSVDEGVVDGQSLKKHAQLSQEQRHQHHHIKPGNASNPHAFQHTQEGPEGPAAQLHQYSAGRSHRFSGGHCAHEIVDDGSVQGQGHQREHERHPYAQYDQPGEKHRQQRLGQGDAGHSGGANQDRSGTSPRPLPVPPQGQHQHQHQHQHQSRQRQHTQRPEHQEAEQHVPRGHIPHDSKHGRHEHRRQDSYRADGNPAYAAASEGCSSIMRDGDNGCRGESYMEKERRSHEYHRTQVGGVMGILCSTTGSGGTGGNETSGAFPAGVNAATGHGAAGHHNRAPHDGYRRHYQRPHSSGGGADDGARRSDDLLQGSVPPERQQKAQTHGYGHEGQSHAAPARPGGSFIGGYLAVGSDAGHAAGRGDRGDMAWQQKQHRPQAERSSGWMAENNKSMLGVGASKGGGVGDGSRMVPNPDGPHYAVGLQPVHRPQQPHHHQLHRHPGGIEDDGRWDPGARTGDRW